MDSLALNAFHTLSGFAGIDSFTGLFDRFDGFEVMMCFLVVITLRALQNLRV